MENASLTFIFLPLFVSLMLDNLFSSPVNFEENFSHQQQFHSVTSQSNVQHWHLQSEGSLARHFWSGGVASQNEVDNEIIKFLFINLFYSMFTALPSGSCWKQLVFARLSILKPTSHLFILNLHFLLLVPYKVESNATDFVQLSKEWHNLFWHVHATGIE